MKATWVSIVVAIGLGIAGMVYAAYSNEQSNQNSRIDSVVEHSTNTRLDVNTIQSDISYIKDDIKESRIVQERIFTKLDAMSNDYTKGD